MKRLFFSLLLLFNVVLFHAQKSLTPIANLPYSHSILNANFILNNSFTQSEKDKELYYKTDQYHVSNLFLRSDSTYFYYFVSPPNYLISFGKYVKIGNKVVLNWDSVQTTKAALDSAIYRKYFKFKTPIAFRIEEKYFCINENRLLPCYLNDNQIELLLKSTDILKVNERINDFKEIHYSSNGQSLLLTYGESKSELIPQFRIWGYVIYDKGSVKVYRRVKKGFNWYGLPGVQVAQVDEMVIYTVGEDRRYSYFSRTMDSPILPLNLKELKKEFRDNKKFINAVSQEFPSNKTLTKLDNQFNSYRVVELYRQSLHDQ